MALVNKKCITVFWGTGSGGSKLLKYWKSANILPDYFTCNNSQLWGSKIGGVQVIAPDSLLSFDSLTIYIVCEAFSQIEKQILGLNLKKARVLRAVYPYYDGMESYYRYWFHFVSDQVNRNRCHKICFSLDFGTILGGIEQFVYRSESNLLKNKINGITLVPQGVPLFKELSPFLVVSLDESFGANTFVQAYNFFISGDFDTVICNHYSEIYVAACLAKEKLGKCFTVHAVCHGDSDCTYRNLLQFKHTVDYIWVISKKIESDLIKHSFDKLKLKKLDWQIIVPDYFSNREYSSSSQPLKIGFAGRITVRQKRVDLFVYLALKLIALNVRFVFNIAGSGDYLETLKNEIHKNNLDNFFMLKGELSKDQILDFWYCQDLFISCSEYEGHSISQCEAIACGCVPVLTDTSGVRDDVEDRVNGYIVPLGDLDAMVSYIDHLHKNRHLLSVMGKYNIDMMRRRCSLVDPFLSFLSENKLYNSSFAVRS